jgi:predicted TIM-barrel fold metal-dependent hydrolase
MEKIDIHCHSTNKQLHGVVQANCDVNAVLDKMKQYDISHTVLLASYFPHKGSGISNFRLQSWIQNHPELVMFGSLDFEHYFKQGFNELEELAGTKSIKGIKIYTGYQNIDFKNPVSRNNFESVVKLAQKYDLPMMFHGGDTSGSYKENYRRAFHQEYDALELLFVAKDFGVKTIVSHLGYPFIDDTIEALMQNKNMFTDTSGLFYSMGEAHKVKYAIDHVKRVLEYCGPDQVLFGTDFPVQTHEHSVEIIESAMKEFSKTDKQKVYSGNAKKILGIK